MTKQEKARITFNTFCKKASKCRHAKYQVSCLSCKEFDACYFQKRIEECRKVMES